MRGSAFDGAIDAARAFATATQRGSAARARDLRHEPRTWCFRSPMTRRASRPRCAEPGTPAGGTHLYDAALRSIELVRSEQLPGGFLVDALGRNGSRQRGRRGGGGRRSPGRKRAGLHRRPAIRQVRSRSADSPCGASGRGRTQRPLRRSELRGIYRALGAELSNVHVLRYRSTARPDRAVEVKAAVAGAGAATARYRSPSLSVIGAAPVDDGSWDSPGVLVLVVLLVVGLIGLALFTLLRGPRQSARDRVAQFVTPLESEETQRVSLTGRLGKTRRAVASAHRLVGGLRHGCRCGRTAVHARSGTRPRPTGHAVPRLRRHVAGGDRRSRASAAAARPAGHAAAGARTGAAGTPALRRPAGRPPVGRRRVAAGGTQPPGSPHGRARRGPGSRTARVHAGGCRRAARDASRGVARGRVPRGWTTARSSMWPSSRSSSARPARTRAR